MPEKFNPFHAMDLYSLADSDERVGFCHWRRGVTPEEWKNFGRDFFEREQGIALGGAMKLQGVSRPLPLLGPLSGENREWIASEEDLRFRLELSHVLHPGWFPDQKENRAFLGELVGKRAPKAGREGRLLNLFSYTGSFSMRAAMSGALETVSVDVSSRYLTWEKKNHALNLPLYEPKGPVRTRLIEEDARKFAARALRRKEKYDWIVLDPPTFSKADGRKVFDVRTEYEDLLLQCLMLLAPGGAILASLNDALITQEEHEEKIAEWVCDFPVRLKSIPPPLDVNPFVQSRSVWLVSE